MTDAGRVLGKERRANRALNPQPAVFLTGYADASGSEPGNMGWGIWVRDSDEQIFRLDACPAWVESTAQAEAYAIAMAVETALEHLDSKSSNIMVVKNDSQGAVQWYQEKQPNSVQMLELCARTFAACNDAGVKLWVKWVKGHQGKRSSTVGYLNHRVDKMAKAGRGEHAHFERKPVFKGDWR